MGFVAPIGAALMGAGASIAGAAAAVAPIATVAAAGAGIYMAVEAGSQSGYTAPALEPLPQAPDRSAIEAEEKRDLLRRRQNATKTILTSPVGLVEPEKTYRKTVLGG